MTITIGNINVKNNYKSFNSINFKGQNMPIEQQQSSDTFEKQKISKGKKFAICLASVMGLVAAGFGIKKGLDIRAGQKFTQECISKLEHIACRKPETTGETLEKTIENVFGKNSGVSPHTYDLSKEFPALRVFRDQGGYIDGIVTNKGIIDISEFSELGNNLARGGSHYVSGDGNVQVVSFHNEKIKNKIVRLIVPDMRSSAERPTSFFIDIISPSSNFTPLQKDILKLADHPEKIDANIFDKICRFMKTTDETGHDLPFEIACQRLGKYEVLDYNLMLSAIQTMVKGL